MNKHIALILAAGKGTRMKSIKPKVLHEICGKSIFQHVIDHCRDAGITEVYGIVGYKHEDIKEHIGNGIGYVIQEEQLGTAHAVMQASNLLENNMQSDVIILMGDAPLITHETIKNMIEHHQKNNYSATVLTANAQEPRGYGRIIRDPIGNFTKIVEQKDATDSQLMVKEINSGVYCFKVEDLLFTLSKISNDNAQGEYYLTDAIQIMTESSLSVGTYEVLEEDIKAVNSKWELSQVERIMQHRINKKLMDEGVTFIHPETSYVHKDVVIGQDTVIYPNSMIKGKTTIGSNCVIGLNCRIENCTIGDNVEIQSSVLIESEVKSDAHIGPFAYIRPNCSIGQRAKIGDFVEVKNATIGDDSKASHLTYIGDAHVGARVNLGCGVVFVNYDGQKKHIAVVEDDCFVGCNTNLISPVTIKKGAYIAAGSTITDDIPPNSLAIARSRQVIKENYNNKK
ncbi:MAG: bifunctional UDP-N-acetylglucosamine diphosphorylase/glucosamine-1-phosphate N-acetyltransferase GlmU [Eubacteriales bacterium]